MTIVRLECIEAVPDECIECCLLQASQEMLEVGKILFSAGSVSSLVVADSLPPCGPLACREVEPGEEEGSDIKNVTGLLDALVPDGLLRIIVEQQFIFRCDGR